MTYLTHPSYNQIHEACVSYLVPAIRVLNVSPDAIVGLSRGGMIPATIISHNLDDLIVYPVSYSSKCGKGDDLNHDNVLPPISPLVTKTLEMPTLLIVDDICDSGNTLHEVYRHYTTKGHMVYAATLYYRVMKISFFRPSFTWLSIPEEAPWIVFPWEVTDVPPTS